MQKPKKFKLLYIGTRDGFKSKKFRDLCADKGDTLSIVKSGDNIFGGYHSLSIKSKSR